MFKIEKNIPIPVGQGRKPVYPWRGMEVGDSFVVQGKRQPSICQCARSAASKLGGGRKFTTRKQNDGSVRVWRIA